jgi:hypothetical protein
LEVRFQEIQKDAKKRNMSDEDGTFRVWSRLACDFAIPGELRTAEEPAMGGNPEAVPDKKEIVSRISAEKDKYLSETALARYSPKMLKMLRNIKDTERGERHNQFVYSSYRSAEGLGIFSAVLEAHGFQR